MRDTKWLEPFRQLFGDEQASYAEALKRHYETGSPADWRNAYISSYATMHPWEDWAETWAHYLHVVDSLATALGFGLEADDLETLITPFVMSKPVVAKLQFVHLVVFDAQSRPATDSATVAADGVDA